MADHWGVRHGDNSALRQYKNKVENQRATMARKVLRAEVHEADVSVSDASEEDAAREVSAGPAPDVDVMYSYDAPSGPGRGGDILSQALNKAVKRYETKVTEKIAKEYEFVDSAKDAVDGYAADADEDDFEFVDLETMH